MAKSGTFVVLLRSVLKHTFLSINILFVLFYLFGVVSTVVAPYKSVFFAYFGLLFPIFVAANVCFIVFWLLKRKKYWLISFATMVLSFAHVNNCVNVPYASFCKKKYSKTIKLLSYNISLLDNQKKIDRIVEFIEKIDADIVCFQEFGYYQKYKDVLKKAIEAKYPHSHIWYKNQTSLYSWGVATFSKFPIAKKQKIDYESKYNVSIYSDIAVDSDTIRIINNHLESNKLTTRDIEKYKNFNSSLTSDKFIDISSLISTKLADAYKIRAKQADAVAYVVRKSEHKVIVCGDFNDVVESYTYKKIKGNLVDLFGKTSWGYRYTFNQNGMYVGIDHILLDKNLIPITLEIPNKNISDHYPLIGVIGIQ